MVFVILMIARLKHRAICPGFIVLTGSCVVNRFNLHCSICYLNTTQRHKQPPRLSLIYPTLRLAHCNQTSWQCEHSERYKFSPAAPDAYSLDLQLCCWPRLNHLNLQVPLASYSTHYTAISHFFEIFWESAHTHIHKPITRSPSNYRDVKSIVLPSPSNRVGNNETQRPGCPAVFLHVRHLRILLLLHLIAISKTGFQFKWYFLHSVIHVRALLTSRIL